jgi:hypothetical protein
MVHDHNNDFYESIVKSMTMASKMISSDAIDDNNNKNDGDSDDDNISYEYDNDDKFDDDESEDNENNNNLHHNNDNNDDANIEDTIESITTTKKHARLVTSNRKRTLPPSLTDPSPKLTSKITTRSHKLSPKVSKELKMGGANYRVNNN